MKGVWRQSLKVFGFGVVGLRVQGSDRRSSKSYADILVEIRYELQHWRSTL